MCVSVCLWCVYMYIHVSVWQKLNKNSESMGESFEFGGIGGFIFLLQSDLMVWYWFKHRIRIGENFYFGGNSDELQGQTLKLLIQDVKWTVFSLFILHSEDVLFCQECDFLPVNFVIISSVFFPWKFRSNAVSKFEFAHRNTWFEDFFPLLIGANGIKNKGTSWHQPD